MPRAELRCSKRYTLAFSGIDGFGRCFERATGADLDENDGARQPEWRECDNIKFAAGNSKASGQDAIALGDEPKRRRPFGSAAAGESLVVALGHELFRPLLEFEGAGVDGAARQAELARDDCGGVF